MPLAVLIAVASLLGLAPMAGVDWYERNRELNSLLDATEASEAAMVAFQRDVKHLVEVAPRTSANAFQDPAALHTDIQAAAGDAAAQVITTGDDVGDVFVLPWHRSLKKAQERYLAHSAAWEDYLEAASRDADALLESHPQITGTFLSAGKAYRDSVPIFSLHNAELASRTSLTNRRPVGHETIWPSARQGNPPGPRSY